MSVKNVIQTHHTLLPFLWQLAVCTCGLFSYKKCKKMSSVFEKYTVKERDQQFAVCKLLVMCVILKIGTSISPLRIHTLLVKQQL